MLLPDIDLNVDICFIGFSSWINSLFFGMHIISTIVVPFGNVNVFLITGILGIPGEIKNVSMFGIVMLVPDSSTEIMGLSTRTSSVSVVYSDSKLFSIEFNIKHFRVPYIQSYSLIYGKTSKISGSF